VSAVQHQRQSLVRTRAGHELLSAHQRPHVHVRERAAGNFNENTGAFILDERNHFLPAGLAKFGRNHGGHLECDPHKGRVATVRQVEQFVTEFVTVEQG
jgi:hypothetical protein